MLAGKMSAQEEEEVLEELAVLQEAELRSKVRFLTHASRLVSCSHSFSNHVQVNLPSVPIGKLPEPIKSDKEEESNQVETEPEPERERRQLVAA